ncbi:MAG: Eco57I restriction-modification methylase domain-containing protein, partial [Chloroflexi bacterium]|nr:Eco57I restriction-modification methylase domain-containing protein [Chloroflexota bacterium]
NIKWGNSLIGSDFFRGPQASLFADEEAMLKVKAFDWDSDAGFGDIMAAGGFDAVIGNPPYVRQEILGKDFKDYAKKKYETYHGVADLYTYFIEQAHRILKSKGVFAMICSNKFMRARYGTALRNYLSKKVKIREIVDFGELPVFESASTFPAIIITSRQLPAEQRFLYAAIKRLDFSTLLEEVKLQGSILDSRSIANNNWTLARSEEIEIMEKMQKIGLPLDSYVGGSIHYGIKTGRNDAFVIDEYVRQSLIEQDIKSEEIIKPFLIGRDVYGYKDLQLKRYVIFTRRGTDIEKYQAIKAYLQQFRTLLEPKPKGWKGTWQGRKPGTYKWYEIQDTVDYHYEFTKPKIIYPVIAKEPRFTIDTKGFYSNDKTFIIPNANLYLLGLLNSKLAWLYLKRTCSVLGDPDKRGRLELRDIYVRTLPIRTIDFDNPEDVKMHDEMVALVDDMLDRHKQLPGLMGEGRKIAEALIQRVDNEIDALVYRLYGLSEDEVAVVEGR